MEILTIIVILLFVIVGVLYARKYYWYGILVERYKAVERSKKGYEELCRDKEQKLCEMDQIEEEHIETINKLQSDNKELNEFILKLKEENERLQIDPDIDRQMKDFAKMANHDYKDDLNYLSNKRKGETDE